MQSDRAVSNRITQSVQGIGGRPSGPPRMTKIAVCLPSRGLICSRTIEALFEAMRGLEWDLYQTHDMGIPECMNHLVTQALKDSQVSHVLFVEEDMLIPKDGVQRMLEEDGDIVAIDYPYPNLKAQKDGSYKHECVSCATYFEGEPQFTGLGCTMVRRHVFETLESPWFVTSPSWEKVVVSKDGKKELFWGRKDVPYKYGGHDINFGLKANWAGFSIKVIRGLIAGHARIKELSQVRKEMNSGSAYTYEIFDRIDKVTGE